MKNRIILLGLTFTLASCGSWNRIGDLTTIGNRNVDDSKKYTLLTREVEAVAEADADARRIQDLNATRSVINLIFKFSFFDLIFLISE